MFPVCSHFVPSLFPVNTFEFHCVPSIPCVPISLYRQGAVQDSSHTRNAGNNRNKAVSPMVCRGRHQEQTGSRTGTIRLTNGERTARVTGRHRSAKAEPFSDIPNRLLTVPPKRRMPKKYRHLNTEERQRLQAAASLTAEPLFIDDAGGIHLIEMHANLRRVQAGQPTADE